MEIKVVAHEVVRVDIPRIGKVETGATAHEAAKVDTLETEKAEIVVLVVVEELLGAETGQTNTLPIGKVKGGATAPEAVMMDTLETGEGEAAAVVVADTETVKGEAEAAMVTMNAMRTAEVEDTLEIEVAGTEAVAEAVKEGPRVAKGAAMMGMEVKVVVGAASTGTAPKNIHLGMIQIQEAAEAISEQVLTAQNS